MKNDSCKAIIRFTLGDFMVNLSSIRRMFIEQGSAQINHVLEFENGNQSLVDKLLYEKLIEHIQTCKE